MIVHAQHIVAFCIEAIFVVATLHLYTEALTFSIVLLGTEALTRWRVVVVTKLEIVVCPAYLG